MLLKPITLRAGGWRENERLLPGTIVPSEVCSHWPLTNRVMMRESRMVRYFLSPDEATEAGARLAQAAQVHPERAQIASGEDLKRDRFARAREVKAQMAARAVAEV